MYFTNADCYAEQFRSNVSIWFCKSNLTIFLVQKKTKQKKKKRKRKRNSSNRKVRIAKDSHSPSSIQIWSSWCSRSWLWSNRVPWGLGFVLGLITEFTLLDRSKVGLWLEMHTRPHLHTCAQRNIGYRSCCLHLAATPLLISKVKHAVQPRDNRGYNSVLSLFVKPNLYACWPRLSSEFEERCLRIRLVWWTHKRYF